MGLFGGSKSSSVSTSTTQNFSETLSQAVGDLSTGNVISGGDATVYGLYGEDMQAFLSEVSDLANKAISAADTAASANSNLSGKAISEVAKSYQSAYSESTGIIQQLKPVLLAGVAVLALVYGSKYLK